MSIVKTILILLHRDLCMLIITTCLISTDSYNYVVMIIKKYSRIVLTILL